jgi:hypothetical protein
MTSKQKTIDTLEKDIDNVPYAEPALTRSKLENKKLEAELDSYEQDRNERKKFAARIFYLHFYCQISFQSMKMSDCFL